MYIRRLRSYYRLSRQHGNGRLHALWHGYRLLRPLYSPFWRKRIQEDRQKRQQWIKEHE